MYISMRYFVFVLCIQFIVYSNLYSDSSTKASEIISYQTQKFNDIIKIIETNYSDSVDYELICNSAFSALLKQLDPHSVYYSADKYKQILESSNGRFDGIGISIISINDTIYISNIIPNSPADSANFCIGDKILFIDNESTIRKNPNEVLKFINGEKNTSVLLKIQKINSNSIIEKIIYRNTILNPCIESAFLLPNTNTAYISITNFTLESSSEFLSIYKYLLKKGMTKLILDLRKNSGGNLEQAMKILNNFFISKDTLCYTKAKNNEYLISFLSDGNGELNQIPLIVLISNTTASAAEAFSGAIQDLDRGLIVGSNSFGKATAERFWSFTDSSGFTMTIAKYFTPSGRCIHKNIDNPIIEFNNIQKNKEYETQFLNQLKSGVFKKSLSVYRTRNGRPVFAENGINPDFYIMNDTTTIFTKLLEKNLIFWKWTFDFLQANKESIINKYNNDYLDFIKKYQIDIVSLKYLILLAKTNNIWNETMYLQDKEYINNYLKAMIAYSIWGKLPYSMILLQKDTLVSKSIDLFINIETILKNK